MKKSEIRDRIISKVKECNYCSIVRVYGLSNGVGYDMVIKLTLTNGKEIKLDAHANKSGWAYPNHLRTDSSVKRYTGSCDVYQDLVTNYWLEAVKVAMVDYLYNLTKNELIKFDDETRFDNSKMLDELAELEKVVKENQYILITQINNDGALYETFSVNLNHGIIAIQLLQEVKND